LRKELVTARFRERQKDAGERSNGQKGVEVAA